MIVVRDSELPDPVGNGMSYRQNSEGKSRTSGPGASLVRLPISPGAGLPDKRLALAGLIAVERVGRQSVKGPVLIGKVLIGKVLIGKE